MVFTLFDICRIDLRKEIENGRAPPDWQLPPLLRKSILDLVLLHGTINEPNCVEILGSADFLRYFTIFDTQKVPDIAGAIAIDDRFLERVAQSLTTVFPNGTTIGSGMEDLRLNLYVQHRLTSVTTLNFAKAIRLISRCPRLRSLDLRVVNYCRSVAGKESVESVNIRGLLNSTGAFQPCLIVIENLIYLSVDGFTADAILINDFPIIRFKNLTTLTVKYCKVYREAWRRLLETIEDTLIDLCLVCLVFEGESQTDDEFVASSEPALPLPLRRLRRFYFDTAIRHGDNYGYLQNLAACEALEYACVRFRISNINQLIMAHLATIKTRARLYVKLWIEHDSRPEDFAKCVQFVDVFGANVSEINIFIKHLTPEFATAFGNAMQKCLNLVLLRLSWIKSPRTSESRYAESNLLAFLKNPERAGRLRNLALNQCDRAVVDALFSNCLHLERLDLAECPSLIDTHLIDWANNGAMPRHLNFQCCRNLGDNGLIAVLEKCGGHLTEFECRYNEKVTDRTWNAVIDNCPNCQTNMPVGLMRKWFENRFFGLNDYEVWAINHQ